MELYELPINEAFDVAGKDSSCGCPVCLLYRRLQEEELDTLLGVSIPNPDIRASINEQGFCSAHYKKMLSRNRAVSVGLMLDTHLESVKRRLTPEELTKQKTTAALPLLEQMKGSCYICRRIDENIERMIRTVIYLWEIYINFREKFSKVPCFCIEHYRRLLEYASKKMDKKLYERFYDTVYGIEKKYLDTLSSDVNWFCKKSDYRYDGEPWYNSKDSVKRAIKFLCGELE